MTDSTKTVFITGATGAIGFEAVRALVAAGHRVISVTRSPEGGQRLLEAGATPVEVDLFDPEAVRQATHGVDVIAHLATSIPQGAAMLRPGAWATNDRLRREGTCNLIAAAEANGIGRIIFESFAPAYGEHGEAWIDESEPLRPVVRFMQSLVDAEDLLAGFERRGGEAVVLRFGQLYGPGRASGGHIEAVRKRQMPVVGNGTNYVSSIHTEDAGTAVVAALTAPAGTYNVCDDEPLRQNDYMDAVVYLLGAPSPRRLPYGVARVLMGGVAKLLVSSQRISNRRFRAATGWTPRYPSARDGWRQVVATAERELVVIR